MNFESTLEGETLSCPSCNSTNIGKVEDVQGVEYSYELVSTEDGLEWEQTDLNQYGDCNTRYTCNSCKYEWT